MRILFISSFNCLQCFADKGDTHYLDLWNYLIDNNDSMSIICENEFSTEEIERFNPEMIWCYHINQVHSVFYNILSYCKKLNVPICMLIDDFFHINFFESSHHDLVDAIVLKVKQDSYKQEYKNKFPHKIIKSIDNHYVNINKFHSWNSEKEYDIFIYGSRRCMLNRDNHSSVYNRYIQSKKCGFEFNFYEFRERLIRLLDCGRYKLNILPYAAANDCPIRGEELSRQINKAYIAVSTRCVVDKCMMKYIEISSSDTVVLGDIPTDYKELFRGNMIEIREDMTDCEILEVVDSALEDRKGLENRGKVFGKRIREMYGSDTLNYLNNFLEICKEIKDEYYSSNHS